MKRAGWGFYSVAMLALAFLIGQLVYLGSENQKSRDQFCLLFGVKFSDLETEGKVLGPIILNHLKEIKENLETREYDDAQLESTFITLCDLAEQNGFKEEAELAKCPP